MESLTFSGVSMEYFGVFQVNFVNLRSFHFGVTVEFSPRSHLSGAFFALLGSVFSSTYAQQKGEAHVHS